MQPVKGVYLGWIPPHGKKWEPLYRTIRCAGGYMSEHTNLYAATIEQYPGLELPLMFHPNPLKLPCALETRTPLSRSDYKQGAHFLDLPYPNMDIFEYIGRTGGLVPGDPFSTCPLIESDNDGVYTYEAPLWNVNQDVRDCLIENVQLQVIFRPDEPLLVTADGHPLGELSPHFTYLGSGIENLKVLRISEAQAFMGRITLISFDTSVNLYATPEFALTSKEAVGV
jgi:hypothetical protein